MTVLTTERLAGLPGVRRALRVRRIVFVIYAVAMTTGTHWPRLEIGTAQMPASDKLIHMIAFGVLAVLLAETRWLRSGWLALVVAAVWACLDEVSQGIPGLGRTISWYDVAANLTGVAVAMAWRAALVVQLSPAALARSGPLRMIRFDLLGDARGLVLTAVGGFLGAVILGPLLFGALRWGPNPAEILDAVLLGLTAGGLIGMSGAMELRLRRRLDAMRRDKPCLVCGGSCAEAVVDGHGHLQCPSCAAGQWIGQWDGPLRFTRSASLRVAIVPVLILLALGIVSAVLYGSMIVLHTRVGWIGDVNRFYGRLPPRLRLVFDLAFLLVPAAGALLIFRHQLARRLQCQDRCCIACGHDLHHTPTTRGAGRCPECGRDFTLVTRTPAS